MFSWREDNFSKENNTLKRVWKSLCNSLKSILMIKFRELSEIKKILTDSMLQYFIKEAVQERFKYSFKAEVKNIKSE